VQKLCDNQDSILKIPSKEKNRSQGKVYFQNMLILYGKNSIQVSIKFDLSKRKVVKGPFKCKPDTFGTFLTPFLHVTFFN